MTHHKPLKPTDPKQQVVMLVILALTCAFPLVGLAMEWRNITAFSVMAATLLMAGIVGGILHTAFVVSKQNQR